MDNTALLVAAVIILIYFYINQKTRRIKIGGNYYNVLDKYADEMEAAETIHDMNLLLMKFMRHIKQKYRINNIAGEDSSENAQIAKLILTGYNPEVIYENDPETGSGTAYTIAKGEKIMFCIRDPKTKKILDIDVLLFVALHEIAHIGNEDWGHDLKFWKIFKKILYDAEEAGIYHPVNYAAEPVNYCGLHVDYNPYFDGRYF